MAALDPDVSAYYLSMIQKDMQNIITNSYLYSTEYMMKDFGTVESLTPELIKSKGDYFTDDQKELITFVKRLLLIYHSSTGVKNKFHKGNGVCYEQMVFPNDDSVYFYVRTSNSCVATVVFCVNDVHFNVPLNGFPTGLGILNKFSEIPCSLDGVKHVQGEIADLMDDYFDTFGTNDVFVSSEFKSYGLDVMPFECYNW